MTRDVKKKSESLKMIDGRSWKIQNVTAGNVKNWKIVQNIGS
jgi:hypothetical protein